MKNVIPEKQFFSWESMPTPMDRVTFSGATQTLDRPPTMVIANRPPYTLEADGQSAKRKNGTGGLATGMMAALTSSQDQWLFSEPVKDGAIKAADYGGYGLDLPSFVLQGVQMTQQEYDAFYGMSNKFWPALHEIDPAIDCYDAQLIGDYRKIQNRYKDAVIEEIRTKGYKGTIFVNDYHNVLLPRLLKDSFRAEGIQNPIGYFHHITIPDFRFVQNQIPQNDRREIYGGLLGADLIGFHDPRWRYNYLQTIQNDFSDQEVQFFYTDANGSRQRFQLDPNMSVSVAELLADTGADDPIYKRLFDPDQQIEIWQPQHQDSSFVGIYNIGHSTETYEAYKTPENIENAKKFRQFYREHGMKSVIAPGRLDYTKGGLELVAAINALLETHPEYIGKVKFIVWQGVARDIPAYKKYGEDVIQAIKTANNKWAMYRSGDQLSTEDRSWLNAEDGAQKYVTGRHDGTLIGQAQFLEEKGIWTPIEHRAYFYEDDEMASLYMGTDLVAITPYMDGRNLISDEAAVLGIRGDDSFPPPGQILSKWAGAYSVLKPILGDNAFDVRDQYDFVRGLDVGLRMNPEERQAQVEALYQHAKANDIHSWSRRLLGDLNIVQAQQKESAAKQGV